MAIVIEMANLDLLGSQTVLVELDIFVMKNSISGFPDTGGEGVEFLECETDAF